MILPAELFVTISVALRYKDGADDAGDLISSERVRFLGQFDEADVDPGPGLLKTGDEGQELGETHVDHHVEALHYAPAARLLLRRLQLSRDQAFGAQGVPDLVGEPFGAVL